MVEAFRSRQARGLNTTTQNSRALTLIGASLSEPHTSELVLKNLLRCIINFRDVRTVVRSGTVLTRAMLKHSKASERMFCGVAALQSS